MRKLMVLVLLVAVLSVPAFAAPVIKLVKGGTNEVLVYVDANDVNLASGIGLVVTATGGNITGVTPAKTGESTSGSKGYGIFPGQIVFNEASEVTDYNTPLAKRSSLGASVILEFGALYDRTVAADAPDPCSLLCALTVQSSVTSLSVTGDITSCGPTVPGGTIPAGIITEDLDVYAVNASITLAAPAPTVASITPATGVYGTTVTVTNLAGTNFVSGATVKLTKSGQADIAGTDVAFVSATQLSCKFVLPYLAISGTWNVVVTNPDAQATTQTVAFVVTTPAAVPTVTSILPLGGAVGVTTLVSDLKGTNFVSGATVKLTKSGSSDIEATNVVVVSATRITCRFAVLVGTATGTWNVVVTNPDARTATKANAFTVGDCMISAGNTTLYNRWVAYGKPSCWCFKKQCNGDADGAKETYKPVMLNDLSLFKAAYNQSSAYVKNLSNSYNGVPLACADFSRSDETYKPVMIGDLTIFKNYYNDSDTSVPQCSGTYISFWTN